MKPPGPDLNAYNNNDDNGAGTDQAGPFKQDGYRARFDWGPNGLRTLAPRATVVVVVDVLRFTSAVSVATARGGIVFPYR